MIRTIAVCLALASSAPAVNAIGARSQETLLDVGPTVERPLARGESHRYQLSLMIGEYARVSVQQKGVAIIVRLRDENGRAIVDFGDEIRDAGEQQAEIVASASGTYTISVDARPDVTSLGSYAVHVV